MARNAGFEICLRLLGPEFTTGEAAVEHLDTDTFLEFMATSTGCHLEVVPITPPLIAFTPRGSTQ